MRCRAYYLYAVLLFVNACGGSGQQTPEQGQSGPNSIAHAGGGIDGITYTNSYEALNSSVFNGFSLIEIDFSWTRDREIVCVHDWDDSMRGVFGFALSEVPTLIEFEKLIDKHAIYEPCRLPGLYKWLDDNPGIKIVTDGKQNNMLILEKISDEYPDFAQRFIPQVHFPEEYEVVVALGYTDIIWTLYRYQGTSADVLNALKSLQLFAVAMSQARVKNRLALAINADISLQKIPLYTYSVNQQSKLVAYRNDWAIDEIYTDFMIAADTSHE